MDYLGRLGKSKKMEKYYLKSNHLGNSSGKVYFQNNL